MENKRSEKGKIIVLKVDFERIKPFSKQTSSTYFVGSLKSRDVEKVFGEAEWINEEMPNEIAIKFKNGIIATIYNRDKYKRLDWSVGGHNRISYIMVALALGEINKKQGIITLVESGIK